MAKKEGGFSFLKIIDYFTNFSGKAKEFIISTEEKAIRIFYSAILLLAGLIFLSISFVFLINEYFELSKGWSFLMMGLILIIVALLIKSKNKK